MSRLNVRCCCRPTEILGTLDTQAVGTPHGFYVRAMTGSGVGYLIGEIEGETHWIEFREVWVDQALERAVYADDRPMEFWRKIPGFIEGNSV